MKLVLTTIFSLLFILMVHAQKETFDLVTYTPPQGWAKEVAENSISYISTNKKTKTWCRIAIIKSTVSKGTIESDFESEWQGLIVKNFSPSDKPEETEVQDAEGWKIKGGSSKFIFENSDAKAMLTTMSGYNRCVSIFAVTNNKDYIKDVQGLLSSIELTKPDTGSAPVNTDNNTASIVGTWIMSSSNQSSYAVRNGISGNIKRQYTFNTNGTYTFFSKTFQYTYDKLLLTKENGTYQISGNNITINPQKSVMQAWSKGTVVESDGRKSVTDKWGNLLSSQNKILEKATYTFTKHYFSGIQQWSLVLQADKPTQRDGPFSTSTTFNNAYYYSGISSTNLVIELPNGQ